MFERRHQKRRNVVHLNFEVPEEEGRPWTGVDLIYDVYCTRSTVGAD